MKALHPPVSKKKNFEVSYVWTCNCLGGASFDSWGIIWTSLVEVQNEMLHTKYQSCIPSNFREQVFWSFPFLFLCSNLCPQWWRQSWPKGHHMYKLGGGPLIDTTYRISMLCAFQRPRKGLLKFSTFFPMFKLVTPVTGPVLSLGQTW